MDLKKFATNKEKEVDGIWHDLGDGLSVLVARAKNTKYISELRLRMKPYQNRLQRNDPSMEEIAEKIITEVMARTILLDWKGMENDGKKFPYSYENCVAVLSDKQYTDFRDLIEGLSDDMSSYRDEEKEAVVKN
jgi:hypothetical protein